MKKIIALAIFALASFTSYSQFHHSLEIGGSNYTGASFSTAYQFQLSKSIPVYLAPKLGIGHIFYWDNAMTVQTGLGIGYKASDEFWWELTSDVSYITTSPFKRYVMENGYRYPASYEAGNLLWYNGVDLKWKPGKKIRYSFGAGILMHYNYYYNAEPSYEFSGDPIPMLKLGIGF